jgi:hypothetical protein
MTFHGIDPVATLTVANHSASVVPAVTRRVLARCDQHSPHYLSLATFPIVTNS